MASTIVGEKREGQGSVKKGNGVTLTFSSTYHFLVVSDDRFTTREQVLLGTPGLPFVGVMYGDIQAICTGIDADRRKDNPFYWDVTCTFSTGSEQQKRPASDPESNDPTVWIPVFKVDSFETRDKVLKEDFTEPTPQKCVNSANTPFADPLIVSDTICVFSFTQFENPSLTLKQIMQRNGCVNKTSFAAGAATYEARTLKLNVTNAEEGVFVDIPAWRIEYRVAYDPDTWDEERLDVGPVTITGESCIDLKNKFKIVGNLNGSGVQTYGEPAKLTFQKRQIEFSDFIRTA
jgi:hypothetical protein